MQEILNNIPPQIVLWFISFIIALVTGKFIIRFLRRLKFRQVIREEGPQSHLKKSGTPTMGGLIFLIPVFIVGIILSFSDIRILPLVLVTLAFALIGFLDDYLKIIKKNNKGLSARQKMILLIIVSGGFTWYAVSYVSFAKTLVLPFLGIASPVTLPVVIAVPFTLFVLVSFTNAVNLTDGIDGLAGSVTIIVLLFYTLVSSLNGEWAYIRLFCAILAGAILGFLVYNLHPAKVFMGDTGALALGGALSGVSILTGTPIFLGLAGIIYVAETLSVIIQVLYFKKTGRRIFLMSPLHHHFEHKGWSETKVVTIFTLVSVISGTIAFLLLRG
jgi:phospho-N-acetylmuramoyl-pentapeptide-transferase